MLDATCNFDQLTCNFDALTCKKRLLFASQWLTLLFKMNQKGG